MDEFEELRRLLLEREQEALRKLRERLDDKEQRARDLSSVLPQAVRLSREGGDQLARALQPAVQSSIKESVEKQPRLFVDLLFPLIGPVVRRSIAESLRGLLQSLNQTLEHTFSWQGLKWRFEALRTGRSFAEVVLLRSLVYRVEQVFLIHKETSLVLLHVTSDAKKERDPDMFAAMLSAFQDFGADTGTVEKNQELEGFNYRGLKIWIEPGPRAFLTMAIHGDPPEEMHATFQEVLESVHIQKGEELAKFSGDAAVFEPLRPELESCLLSQLQEKHEGLKVPTFALILLAAFAALLICGLAFVWERESRWRDYIARMNAEPGIAVVIDDFRWLGRSRVAGMHDPLAVDPATFAKPAGIDATDVDFVWKDFLALDPVSVRRRFEQRFGLPKDGKVVMANGVAEIAGSVPYEWIERVRREAAQVPGVTAIAERDVTLTYDPALALRRFETAHTLPQGVTARIENGTLILAGTAPYEWIAPVREGAVHVRGISALSEKELKVAFDPTLALQRFTTRFGLPDSVNAAWRERTLVLSGEASHRWVTRVREGATALPGIAALDESGLTDMDLRTFQQTKSVIETAFVYFLVNKDNFATEGFAALSRLPDEIRNCHTAAKRLGISITVEVRGFADGVGAGDKNLDLSRRRAEAVTNFLVTCGLDAALFTPLGLGAPPPAADGKPAAEQSDRRVAFRIISQQ